MNRIILLVLCFPVITGAQSLSSFNFASSYSTQSDIVFVAKQVKLQNEVAVFFELKVQTATASLSDYQVTWEKRNTSSEKVGELLSVKVDTLRRSEKVLRGKISFARSSQDWFLLIKVAGKVPESVWRYVLKIEDKYPVNGYVQTGDGPVLEPYVRLNVNYTLVGSGSGKPLSVFYYKQAFPAGSPPFAERGEPVDRFLFADSTFRLSPGSEVSWKKEGLYLVQEDTTLAEGFAFRAVNENYPRYARMDELTPPLIFVTTQVEYNQLVAANNEKPKFDKVILDITRDQERAKKFMRSYFRGVEVANALFTSYKEGWKTDRGMIYLIYGHPDEVSRNDNNEIWYYKNFQTRFTFVKSGSVYDPNLFVLLRDKRYTEKWYSIIDLWRKSRY
jgi:GWxTD domain-containing protein